VTRPYLPTGLVILVEIDDPAFVFVDEHGAVWDAVDGYGSEVVRVDGVRRNDAPVSLIDDLRGAEYCSGLGQPDADLAAACLDLSTLGSFDAVDS
jgi:hypothetical protein